MHTQALKRLFWLSLCLLFAGFIVLGARWEAHAQSLTTAPSMRNAPNLHLLITALNGRHTKIGTLISAGSSVTNATTATPFSLVGGAVHMVECAAAAHVGLGSTASATVTNANYKPKVDAAPNRIFFIPHISDTAMAMIPASGATDCAVFTLQ